MHRKLQFVSHCPYSGYRREGSEKLRSQLLIPSERLRVLPVGLQFDIHPSSYFQLFITPMFVSLLLHPLLSSV